jgi:tetratricopeptide (TPR) repeat protein
MFERAHKVAPRSTVPLWNLYFHSMKHHHGPATAEWAARTLVTLLPDHAHANHAVAWSLVAQRRFQEAEEEIQATLALDPFHAFALPNLGHLQLRRGAAAMAVTTYRRVLSGVRDGSIKTGTTHLMLCLSLALLAAGKKNEAQQILFEAAEEIVARGQEAPLDAGDQGAQATGLAIAGRRNEASQVLEQISPDDLSSPSSHVWLARAWAVLGDRQKAMSYLDEAFSAGYDDPYLFLIDPTLEALRSGLDDRWRGWMSR